MTATAKNESGESAFGNIEYFMTKQSTPVSDDYLGWLLVEVSHDGQYRIEYMGGLIYNQSQDAVRPDPITAGKVYVTWSRADEILKEDYAELYKLLNAIVAASSAANLVNIVGDSVEAAASEMGKNAIAAVSAPLHGGIGNINAVASTLAAIAEGASLGVEEAKFIVGASIVKDTMAQIEHYQQLRADLVANIESGSAVSYDAMWSLIRDKRYIENVAAFGAHMTTGAVTRGGSNFFVNLWHAFEGIFVDSVIGFVGGTVELANAASNYATTLLEIGNVVEDVARFTSSLYPNEDTSLDGYIAMAESRGVTNDDIRPSETVPWLAAYGSGHGRQVCLSTKAFWGEFGGCRKCVTGYGKWTVRGGFNTMSFLDRPFYFNFWFDDDGRCNEEQTWIVLDHESDWKDKITPLPKDDAAGNVAGQYIVWANDGQYNDKMTMTGSYSRDWLAAFGMLHRVVKLKNESGDVLTDEEGKERTALVTITDSYIVPAFTFVDEAPR